MQSAECGNSFPIQHSLTFLGEIILDFVFCILHFYKIIMNFRKKQWTNRTFFDRIVRL